MSEAKAMIVVSAVFTLLLVGLIVSVHAFYKSRNPA